MGDSLLSAEYKRALFSALAFSAVAFATGGGSLGAIAFEGIVQGGASVASDLAHLYVLRSAPSAISGPAVTGLIYSGYKAFSGDSNYVSNAVYSAGVDWASDHIAAMFVSADDSYVPVLADQAPMAMLSA